MTTQKCQSHYRFRYTDGDLHSLMAQANILGLPAKGVDRQLVIVLDGEDPHEVLKERRQHYERRHRAPAPHPLLPV